MASAIDPTRVIQGIVTGIGFLGAGVIMREGFSISGLTTAASIWGASAIGVLVGVGFYLAAIGLAVLSAGIMVYLSKLEGVLPSRHAIAISMRFHQGYIPREPELRRMALERGYEIAGGSLTISSDNGIHEWRFVALALSKLSGAPLSELSQELSAYEGVSSFKLAHARN
jgi:putative Mg2+ transporter-C (MgtC) family protein